MWGNILNIVEPNSMYKWLEHLYSPDHTFYRVLKRSWSGNNLVYRVAINWKLQLVDDLMRDLNYIENSSWNNVQWKMR